MPQCVLQRDTSALGKSDYGKAGGIDAAIFARLSKGLVAQLHRFGEEGFVRLYGIPEAVGVPASDIASRDDPSNSLQIAETGSEVHFAFGCDSAPVQEDSGELGCAAPASDF